MENELPLFVLWDEQNLRDRYSFRTWTNWSKVVEIAGHFDGNTEALREPEIARGALAKASISLAKVSQAAIYDLMDTTSKAPSQICNDYWFPNES